MSVNTVSRRLCRISTRRTSRARSGSARSMSAISASAGAGSNARSVTALISASLPSKTRKIVPSATSAASAICRVVTPGPCHSTSGSVALINASRRSAGGMRRARSLRTGMVTSLDERALTTARG